MAMSGTGVFDIVKLHTPAIDRVNTAVFPRRLPARTAVMAASGCLKKRGRPLTAKACRFPDGTADKKAIRRFAAPKGKSRRAFSKPVQTQVCCKTFEEVYAFPFAPFAEAQPLCGH